MKSCRICSKLGGWFECFQLTERERTVACNLLAAAAVQFGFFQSLDAFVEGFPALAQFGQQFVNCRHHYQRTQCGHSNSSAFFRSKFLRI